MTPKILLNILWFSVFIWVVGGDYCLITHEPEWHKTDTKSAVFWLSVQIISLGIFFNVINFEYNYFYFLNIYMPRTKLRTALYVLPFFFLIMSPFPIAHAYNDAEDSLDKIENSKNAYLAMKKCDSFFPLD